MSNTYESSPESSDTDCTKLIKRIRRPIFQGTLFEYGITVNIQPTKKMNRRYWKLYNHDQQRAILSRIEAKFRALTPSVQLMELHYEVCPTLKNIHFHALYKAPALFKVEMMAYYKRVCCSDDLNTTDPWRYLDIKLILGGNAEWLEYIRKDLKT